MHHGAMRPECDAGLLQPTSDRFLLRAPLALDAMSFLINLITGNAGYSDFGGLSSSILIDGLLSFLEDSVPSKLKLWLALSASQLASILSQKHQPRMVTVSVWAIDLVIEFPTAVHAS